jgi:hypothetical protein
VQYYHENKRVRASSHSTDRKVAQQLLQKRLVEIATGQYQGVAAEKVTLGTLIDLVIRDYHFRKLNNARKIEWTVPAHLEGLRELPAAKFTTDDVEPEGRADFFAATSTRQKLVYPATGAGAVGAYTVKKLLEP